VGDGLGGCTIFFNEENWWIGLICRASGRLVVSVSSGNLCWACRLALYGGDAAGWVFAQTMKDGSLTDQA